MAELAEAFSFIYIGLTLSGCVENGLGGGDVARHNHHARVAVWSRGRWWLTDAPNPTNPPNPTNQTYPHTPFNPKSKNSLRGRYSPRFSLLLFLALVAIRLATVLALAPLVRRLDRRLALPLRYVVEDVGVGVCVSIVWVGDAETHT